MKRSKNSDHKRQVAAYLKRWSARSRTQPAAPTSRRDPPPVEKPTSPRTRFRPRFTPITQREFNELLDVLPPLGMSAKGFLVGEPWSHRPCHVTSLYSPTYQAVVEHGKQFWKSLEGLTRAEWRALDPVTLDVM